MSWIAFDEQPSTKPRPTRRWAVRPIEGSRPLGIIKWFAPWRRYAFFPAADTIFEHECLREIADFVIRQTHERRAARAIERAAERAWARE